MNDLPHLKSETLGEACANGDGTFDGYKALQWMQKALGHKVMPREEMEKLWEEAKAKAAVKRANP